MSEAKKGSPKIALNMSMVKTIMWDKGPDYTFERVKAAGLSYFVRLYGHLGSQALPYRYRAWYR